MPPPLGVAQLDNATPSLAHGVVVHRPVTHEGLEVVVVRPFAAISRSGDVVVRPAFDQSVVGHVHIVVDPHRHGYKV